ncbi:MAG: YicC/YloC family endoribonuclease [Bilophila wadsworthia]
MLDQVAALATCTGHLRAGLQRPVRHPTLWERESEDGDDEMEERLEEGLIAALEDWNESRETEGAALARDMTSASPRWKNGFRASTNARRDQGRTVRRAPRASFRSPRRRQR